MNENNLDDILKIDNLNIDKKLILTLDENRKKGAASKLPEEIALQYDLTRIEMEEIIDKSDSIELKRSWALYRENLKVKFAVGDKDLLKELQANYNLGMDSKSFPNISFNFGNSWAEMQVLNIILEQTKLQREKNAIEAESMGIKVMNDEDRKRLQNALEELDE